MIQDPVFGTIVGDDGIWEAREPVEFLGRLILLLIDADEKAGPTEHQRQRFREFLEKRDTLKPGLEAAIFQYYQDENEMYRTFLAQDEIGEYLPTLTTPEQIWDLTAPVAIHIPRQSPEDQEDMDCDLAIEWSTSWDVEHGLKTCYRNWEIVAVVMP
ncbi:DUF6985 domain-containing protein [Capsulimonas corticalis]|uniref:DUF6985 domain-containing protein n=1 Tax=Capsulimonas corticalis TaxID=2219043 RepID=UPI000F64F8DB|nr:hypothetical protein [Capsulimonas corticalis]